MRNKIDSMIEMTFQQDTHPSTRTHLQTAIFNRNKSCLHSINRYSIEQQIKGRPHQTRREKEQAEQRPQEKIEEIALQHLGKEEEYRERLGPQILAEEEKIREECSEDQNRPRLIFVAREETLKFPIDLLFNQSAVFSSCF